MWEVIHVGFTGTRHGMTPAQRHGVQIIVRLLKQCDDDLVAHHGDCIGADAEFHGFMREVGARVVIHPGRSAQMLALPDEQPLRAFCVGDEVLEPIGHFKRNRAIVAVADVMIATPYESMRQDRGGTWYTIDRAEKSGKPLAIVLPTRYGTRVDYRGAGWPEPP